MDRRKPQRQASTDHERDGKHEQHAFGLRLQAALPGQQAQRDERQHVLQRSYYVKEPGVQISDTFHGGMRLRISGQHGQCCDEDEPGGAVPLASEYFHSPRKREARK